MTLLQCNKIYSNVYMCTKLLKTGALCVIQSTCSMNEWVHVISQTKIVDVRYSKETNLW